MTGHDWKMSREPCAYYAYALHLIRAKGWISFKRCGHRVGFSQRAVHITRDKAANLMRFDMLVVVQAGEMGG